VKRAIPFVILGIIGLAGYFTLSPSAGPDPVKPTPKEQGSVKLITALEHGKLLNTGWNETYARVVLEGEKVDGPTDRVPVSLTIVIDRSGSMYGDKIENARASALAALEQLKDGDRVSVIAFSSGARTLTSRLVIGEGNIDAARRAIEGLSATGGTDMVAGLNEAIVEASRIAGEGRTQRVLLLSDGQPDTENGLDELVTRLSRTGVTTTTLGLGRDYNEDLMARLADKGLGNYYFIESPNQMAGIFEKELKDIASVVARRAVVKLQPMAGVEVVQVYGYESGKSGNITNVPVGDIYGGRRADLLVKLRVQGQDKAAELLKVDLDYEDALADKQRHDESKLAAVFTSAADQVASSRDFEVAERVERVRSAEALEEASKAIAQGRKAEARRIFNTQKNRIKDLKRKAKSAPKPSKKAAKAFDDLDDVFGGYARDAEAAPAAVATKRAKQRARAFKK
jgi:Ca-activated chloride channel family protein